MYRGINFAELKTQNEEHDFFHHTLPNGQGKEDKSCSICFNTWEDYRPDDIRPEWYIFWNWYTTLGAKNYSGTTQDCFEGSLTATSPGNRRFWIIRLVKYTRFGEVLHQPITLLREIEEQFENGFQQEEIQPQTQEPYQFSSVETSATEDTEESVSHISSDEEPRPLLLLGPTEDYFEDYFEDFQQLFYEMGDVMANALIALTAQLVRNHSVPLPTFAGKSQEDPIQWFNEYNRISTANGYDDAYKLRMVGASFKDSAAVWYDGQQNIQNWAVDNDANAFKTRFMNQYRTQNKIIQWRQELEKRIQLPGESVEHYAQDVRGMIQKIAPGNEWTDEQKAYSFTKGLRDEIYERMSPILAVQQNPTLNLVVTLAQRIEDDLRYRSSKRLQFQRNAPVLAVPDTGLSAEITQMIAETVRQAVTAAMANQRPRPTQGQNNNGTPQNRPPPTCYACREIGHTAKYCPNRPSVAQATQPAQQPKTTQALVADTSEMEETLIPNEWSLNY